MDSASDLVGKSLGRYDILKQLGKGGMATVYKAYDTRLETDVAVKVIRTENILPSALEQSRKRFEREAKVLARLNHPNIVRVTDYGEYKGKPYLVMPYFPSGTLKQKMGKPMPWREAIQILLPIAEALDYAHSQNMIHRDVKPSNILLTQRGQPMLTDFGIAKILNLEDTNELTGTNVAIGTPEYMAPEQASAKTVDHRADIYSLGIVFYEMVTGRKPFMADTPMAVLIKHATEALPRPKQFAPDLPDEVEKVLFAALAKQPQHRFQSMDEFAVALKRSLEIKAAAPAIVQPPRLAKPEESKIKDTVPAPAFRIQMPRLRIPAARGGVFWLGVAVIIAAVCLLAFVLPSVIGIINEPTPTRIMYPSPVGPTPLIFPSPTRPTAIPFPSSMSPTIIPLSLQSMTGAMPTGTSTPAATSAPDKILPPQNLTAVNHCSDNIYVYKLDESNSESDFTISPNVSLTVVIDAVILPNRTINLTGAVKPGSVAWSGYTVEVFWFETTGPFHSHYSGLGWVYQRPYSNEICLKFFVGNAVATFNPDSMQFEYSPPKESN
jgi:serine/threonine protein kinase